MLSAEGSSGPALQRRSAIRRHAVRGGSVPTPSTPSDAPGPSRAQSLPNLSQLDLGANEDIYVITSAKDPVWEMLNDPYDSTAILEVAIDYDCGRDAIFTVLGGLGMPIHLTVSSTDHSLVLLSCARDVEQCQPSTSRPRPSPRRHFRRPMSLSTLTSVLNGASKIVNRIQCPSHILEYLPSQPILEELDIDLRGSSYPQELLESFFEVALDASKTPALKKLSITGDGNLLDPRSMLKILRGRRKAQCTSLTKLNLYGAKFYDPDGGMSFHFQQLGCSVLQL